MSSDTHASDGETCPLSSDPTLAADCVAPALAFVPFGCVVAAPGGIIGGVVKVIAV